MEREESRIRFLRRPKTKPMTLLATIGIFVLFLIIMQPELWSRSFVTPTEGTVNYTEELWTLENEDGSIHRTVDGHEQMFLEPNQAYRVSTQVTYDGEGDENPYLFLEMSHLYCRVFLEDELLFHYMAEDVHKSDRARSPGYLYKAIPLPYGFQGKELTVEFTPVLRLHAAYTMPHIFFGDYSSTVKAVVRQDLPHNILTVLCLLLGFSALIFSAFSFTGSDYREGFNIGTFSLLVALYFMADCDTNYYYIGNPYYMYFMNLLALSLMPVSFMGVMREFLDGMRKRICTVVIVIEMTLFVLEIGLHVSGILDFREALPIIHFVGFAEVILVSILFLTIKKKRKKYSLLLQLMPIAIGMVVDAVIYWNHLEIGLNDSTFTTIGLVIFLTKQLVSKVITQARKVTNMQRHTIEGMATLIESRDGITGAHVRNTGVYAKMLAKEMYKQGQYPNEIDRSFVNQIGWMAQLHDVGKIKISDTILNKPGKFTPEEYEIMKTHTTLGGEIIQQIMSEDMDPEIVQMAFNIATYHHERWDGKGYPTGKKGTEIPLCARIMAVADVFDAMSSKRVYKPEMAIDDVFAELEANENKQFQKEIVEVAIAIRPQLEEYLNKNRESTCETDTLPS